VVRQSVQWQGDNADQIERLLREHVARADKEGDQCRIRGVDGLNIVLELGDRITIDGDRLGVLRKAVADAEPMVVWTGTNLREIAEFLKTFQVRLDVVGQTLFVYEIFNAQPAVLLQPGDRMIDRANQIIVRKAGKDHRA
jgi:hypothetical protein